MRVAFGARSFAHWGPRRHAWTVGPNQYRIVVLEAPATDNRAEVEVLVAS